MTKEDVLKKCTVEGNVVKLPAGQLDKKMYDQVKKALGLIGGSWKGGKVAGFVFEKDPTELLEEIATGVKRNIKKEFQFYATSPKLSDKVVKMADVQSGEKILEPSAGRGAIVDAINRLFLDVEIHCCELMQDNKDFLLDRGEIIVGDDFLKFETDVRYDKIIANPPFNKNQDIKHLRKMYDLLAEDGKVVCICSVSWIQATNKEAKQFRAWLDDDNYFTDDKDAPMKSRWHIFGNIGTDAQFTRKNGDTVYIEMLDSSMFKSSGVNVKTCIISIDRYTAI